MDCIFCKIAKKEAKADIVFEKEEIIAFLDIAPKAPFHILIIPKKHISSLKEVTPQDKQILAELLLGAKEIAKEKGLAGYKVIINVGKKGGQIIEHLHLHLLSGEIKKLP